MGVVCKWSTVYVYKKVWKTAVGTFCLASNITSLSLGATRPTHPYTAVVLGDHSRRH